MFQKIGFIGLGLIGGSIAKKIHTLYPDVTIIATAGHQETITEAYGEHLISNQNLCEIKYFSVHTGKKKYRIPAPVKGKYQKRMYHHRCRKRQNRYSRRSDCPRNGGLLYRRASDGRL